jgi:hypothetical protein
MIQPFQRPERVVGFFNTYRQLYPVRYTLRDIADQFQRWVKERVAKRNIPMRQRAVVTNLSTRISNGQARCSRGHPQSSRACAHHDR